MLLLPPPPLRSTSSSSVCPPRQKKAAVNPPHHDMWNQYGTAVLAWMGLRIVWLTSIARCVWKGGASRVGHSKWLWIEFTTAWLLKETLKETMSLPGTNKILSGGLRRRTNSRSGLGPEGEILSLSWWYHEGLRRRDGEESGKRRERGNGQGEGGRAQSYFSYLYMRQNCIDYFHTNMYKYTTIFGSSLTKKKKNTPLVCFVTLARANKNRRRTSRTTSVVCRIL